MNSVVLQTEFKSDASLPVLQPCGWSYAKVGGIPRHSICHLFTCTAESWALRDKLCLSRDGDEAWRRLFCMLLVQSLTTRWFGFKFNDPYANNDPTPRANAITEANRHRMVPLLCFGDSFFEFLFKSRSSCRVVRCETCWKKRNGEKVGRTQGGPPRLHTRHHSCRFPVSRRI